MRARQVWHARDPRSRARKTYAVLGALALLVTAAAPVAADPTSDGDTAPEQQNVQVPSNDELRELLAEDPSVQVVDQRLIRAADGAIGAGIEITPAGYGTVWLGAYGMPAGVPGDMAWCTQARIYPGVGEAPSASSALDDRALAWVEETYADLGNAAAQSAIGYLVHMRHETPGTMAGGNVDQVKALIDGATPAAVRDLANQMIAEGARQSGPYSGPALSVDDTNLRYGRIDGLGVLSAAGEFVPGVQGTVVLRELVNGAWVPTDRAVFDTNGNRRPDPGETNTVTLTSQSTGISLNYVAARGAGEIRPMATWTGGMKSRQYSYYNMGVRQNVLVLNGGYAGGDPVEYAGPTFRVAADFRPMGVSSAPASVPAGSRLVDTFVPSTHPEDEWVVLEDGRPVPVAYEVTVRDVGSTPVGESATAPAGEVVGSQVVVATQGDGVPIEVDLGESEASTYVYTWETSEALQAATPETAGFVDYIRDGWSWTDGTKHDETTIVRYPTEITSSLSIRETINGVMLVDDQWVDILDDAGSWAGIPPRWQGDTPTYTNTLYRVEGEVSAESCTPDRVWGKPVEVQATPGFKPSIGDLSWLIPHEELAAAAGATWVAQHTYSGDARTEAFTSPCDDVTQAFRIPEPEPEPLAVTTKAQSSTEVPVAGDGGTLSDTHLVTGTVPDGAQGRSSLFLDADGDGVFTPDEKVWTSSWVQYTDGAGEYEIPEGFAYGDVEGVYTFDQETVDVDGVRIAYEPPGHPDQTITVLPGLAVTTKAHSSTEVPTAGDGGALSDTHIVTGTVPDGAKGRSTLFLDADGDGKFTDDEAVWTSEWVEYTDGPGEYQIPDAFSYGDVHGTYTFDQETVDPDGEVIAYEPPGHPDQTITVRPADADVAAAEADDDTALAMTGASQVAAMFAIAAVLAMAGGSLARWSASRRVAAPATG